MYLMMFEPAALRSKLDSKWYLNGGAADGETS